MDENIFTIHEHESISVRWIRKLITIDNISVYKSDTDCVEQESIPHHNS